MAFNISEFITRGLPQGGARPSQFRVVVTPPFASVNTPKLTFTCQAASVPAAITGSIPVFYFGRAAKFAGDREFPDWNVEVLNDEDFAVRKIMERWSNLQNNMVGNVRSDSIDIEGYKSIALVEQLGKQGDVIGSYEFYGIFPTVVGEMQLSWAAQNQIQTFGVTFAYDYWIPVAEGDTDGYRADIE